MSRAPTTVPAVIPVGRSAECERLAHLVDEAAAGHRRAIVLLGPAGIGKTTLVRWAMDRTRSRDFLTASVRAPAAAGLPPRFPIGELLEGLIESCGTLGARVPDPLERVVGTLRGNTSADTYPAALPQIANALDAAGEIAPLALSLDDYHWAPREGADLLLASLRVTSAPMIFIGSARLASPEQGAALPEPTADLWVERLEVGGLSAEAVAEIAGRVVGGEILPSLARALHARTLGNALFVGEMLRAWQEMGALEEVGGFVGIEEEAGGRWPASLRDTISIRFSRLGTNPASVAAVVATLGREARFEELRDVTHLGGDELVAILDDLVEQGIADESGPPPRFRIAHPLYEQALFRSIGQARRAALNGKVFEMLSERRAGGASVSASELAHHAVAALERPTDLRFLIEAAAVEAEAAGGYEEAARWYGHLAGEASDDDGLLARALEGQANATVHFDPINAVELFSAALDMATSDARARLLTGRAYAERLVGEFDRALGDLATALSVAGPEEGFDIKHGTAVIHGIQGRIDEAEGILQRLAEESIGSSDHAKAIGHLGQVAFSRGDLVAARELWERALTESAGHSYTEYVRANLAWLDVILGKWESAELRVWAGLSAARASGDIWNHTTVLTSGARLFAWKGNLPVAFDMAIRGRSLASRTFNPACRVDALDALGVALLEHEMYRETIDQMLPIRSLISSDMEARELAFTFAVLAEAQLRLGELNSARSSLDTARDRLVDAPFWRVRVDRLDAQLLSAERRHGAALDTLTPWIETPSRMPFEQAQVYELAAQIQMELKATEALEMASRAHVLMTGLGATLRARKLAEWIRAHHRRPRGRPRSALPGGITPREAEVLHFVAAGHTNREIADLLTIAPGTAKKHVENLLAKLGVRRRAQLLPFARETPTAAEE